MKTINLYQCEYCGTQYNNKADAATCEKNHKHPVFIKSSRFHGIKSDATGYPMRVVLEMDDGKAIEYRRY